LNVLTLCDFEFLKKFKNKIYFFDDLNLWKINNNIEYINNLIFDAYLTPLEENVDGLKSKLKNVIYLPFSSSYSSIVANRHSKTLPISMFLDIWRNRGTETDRGEISLAKAVNFFNNIKYKNISIFVHEAFSRDIYGTNVKYISDMPKAQFHEFIKDMWFYATSIQSSYEFIVLESTLFGSLCIDIDNSVRVEHRKSRATIANEFFYSNYENIIENYSSDRNSCEAREIYCSGQYDAVFSAILK
jgi:hypothetical protein